MRCGGKAKSGWWCVWGGRPGRQKVSIVCLAGRGGVMWTIRVRRMCVGGKGESHVDHEGYLG